jgi:hypothetical protein
VWCGDQEAEHLSSVILAEVWEMTFIELISLIGERGEKVISDKLHVIQTDKHVYSRSQQGEWKEQEKKEKDNE